MPSALEPRCARCGSPFKRHELLVVLDRGKLAHRLCETMRVKRTEERRTRGSAQR